MKLETLNLWVDRAAELGILQEAWRQRRSLLVWGAEDAGKTALIDRLRSGLGLEERRSFLHVDGPATLHEVLRRLIQQLWEVGDAHLRKRSGSPERDTLQLRRWLDSQSSSRLRAMLYQAVRKNRYGVVLDHLPPLSYPMARLVKEIIWRCETPVFLLARGFLRKDVGHAWSLYWTDKYRMQVEPLSEADARELMNRCIRHCGLADLRLGGFRDDVLRLSGRLPGAIVKMCALAAQPRYRYGQEIMTRLVRVDYLLAGERARHLGHKGERVRGVQTCNG